MSTSNQLNRRNQVRRANFMTSNPNVYQRKWFTGICNGTLSLSENNISFLIYQEEKGAKTGTIHFQGYVEFIKIVRPVGKKYRKKKEWLNTNWSRVDNPLGAIKYASKLATRLVGGQHGKAGHARKNREDTVMDVIAHFKEEKDIAKVVKAHPLVSFHHYNKLVRYGMAGLERTSCKVMLLVGPSGVGKSWFAKKLAKANGSYYEVPAKTSHNDRWDWQKYIGQETIIVNEWDDTWINPKRFNMFFDEQTFQVEKKGHCLDMVSNNMILTSNKDPKYWYRKWRAGGGYTEPLERRITQFFTIFDCKKNPDFDNEYEEDEDNMFITLTERVHPRGGFRFASPEEFGNYNFNADEGAGVRINKKRKRQHETDPEEEERTRKKLKHFHGDMRKKQ